ncbi:SHOCT domain-containing protein [Aquabacterium sp. A7-Y]|uniref:SHOCT domain-containing protein n=1 Tax=Aquabacterium sp. A7-Y TaxID=1349605 RepID=UPI00223D92A4|nr:SHOCT domain-containing protein [Aquabacterium sp. A7-Y]MCW7540941.1 SHOCT domain-containing protein [Aquabacterium sp. A7-Y]
MHRRRTPAALACAAAAAFALSAPPAAAGVMDFLFGSKAQQNPSDTGGKAGHSKRRIWSIGEFTAVRLEPAEAGAPANQHPAVVTPEQLSRWLGGVSFSAGERSEALFHPDELKYLVEPLFHALKNAGPGDDVLLLSTSKRDGGLLSVGYGVTARLFVQGGELHLIVNDTRLDFVNAYRGSHIVPDFTFGSRTRQGAAQLSSATGASRRADWVAFSLAEAAAPAPAPAAAVAAPARPAVTAAPAPSVAPAPAAAAPAAPGVRDNRFFEEQEQRLRTLKRLREQNLISEEEFQQKRREILQTL